MFDKIKEYKKTVVSIIISSAIAMTIFDGYFITQEGSVTVVKRAGKVIDQKSPGFHFKVPLVDSYIHIDVRERKSVETMSVSTSGQMKAQGVVSINWSAQKNAVKGLFTDYGSLEQFETKVLDPKLREIAKQSIAKYSAEQNIVQRDIVTNVLRDAFMLKVKDLPIDVSSVQIEDIEFSQTYLKSIDTKQTQKNLAEAEKYTLEKQNLQAQQKVNTANADGEAIERIAKAEAKSILIKGKAEAEAIEAKAKALAGNPLIVELAKAQRWDGKYPTTMMGSDSNVLMDIRK